MNPDAEDAVEWARFLKTCARRHRVAAIQHAVTARIMSLTWALASALAVCAAIGAALVILGQLAAIFYTPLLQWAAPHARLLLLLGAAASLISLVPLFLMGGYRRPKRRIIVFLLIPVFVAVIHVAIPGSPTWALRLGLATSLPSVVAVSAVVCVFAIAGSFGQTKHYHEMVRTALFYSTIDFGPLQQAKGFVLLLRHFHEDRAPFEIKDRGGLRQEMGDKYSWLFMGLDFSRLLPVVTVASPRDATVVNSNLLFLRVGAWQWKPVVERLLPRATAVIVAVPNWGPLRGLVRARSPAAARQCLEDHGGKRGLAWEIAKLLEAKSHNVYFVTGVWDPDDMDPLIEWNGWHQGVQVADEAAVASLMAVASAI